MKPIRRCLRILILALLSVTVFAPIVFFSHRLKHLSQIGMLYRYSHTHIHMYVCTWLYVICMYVHDWLTGYLWFFYFILFFNFVCRTERICSGLIKYCTYIASYNLFFKTLMFVMLCLAAEKTRKRNENESRISDFYFVWFGFTFVWV